MDKNTKNLLTAGAVIVGGIILLKGAKEFLGETSGEGSIGGSDSGNGFGGAQNTPKDKTDDSNNKKEDKPTNTALTTNLDTWSKNYQNLYDISTGAKKLNIPYSSDPIKTTGGGTMEYMFGNPNDMQQDIASGYIQRADLLLEYVNKLTSNPLYKASSTMQAEAERYLTNPTVVDYLNRNLPNNFRIMSDATVRTIVFRDENGKVTNPNYYGADSSITENVKAFETSKLLSKSAKEQNTQPLKTPDTSKLSETKFGYDVLAGLSNPISYIPFGLASQAVLEYGDYKVTEIRGQNILERNYTEEELEKMSNIEKSYKQEYQKVAEPFRALGSSVASNAKKIVSYSSGSKAKTQTTSTPTIVKTTSGSTKSSGSSSSSKSSGATIKYGTQTGTSGKQYHEVSTSTGGMSVMGPAPKTTSSSGITTNKGTFSSFTAALSAGATQSVPKTNVFSALQTKASNPITNALTGKKKSSDITKKK